MASLAELMCVEIDSFDMGIYLTPEVVPLVLEKYNGFPDQSMFGSPFLTFSTYDFIFS